LVAQTQTKRRRHRFAALALASARDIVARLPDGLDAELGETGGGVSGGEARRLMLARAALSGRPVLLADEPTADLDTTTAAEVIAALHGAQGPRRDRDRRDP
jgi:ATP-binding cassette subfamily C protein CydD